MVTLAGNLRHLGMVADLVNRQADPTTREPVRWMVAYGSNLRHLGMVA